MLTIRETDEFATWLAALRDHQARARIARRIDRLALGNPGDAKGLGGGLAELRIDYGPGYRVYFTRRGSQIVVLLCAGSKRTQQKDTAAARRLLADMEEEE